MGNSNISVPHWSVLEPFFSHQNQTQNWTTMMAASSSPSIRNINWIDDDTRAPFYRSMAWDRYTVGRFSTAIVVGTNFNVEFGASANLRIQLVSSSAPIYYRWTMPLLLLLLLILHTCLKPPRVPSFATKILPLQQSRALTSDMHKKYLAARQYTASVSQTCQPNHHPTLIDCGNGSNELIYATINYKFIMNLCQRYRCWFFVVYVYTWYVHV